MATKSPTQELPIPSTETLIHNQQQPQPQQLESSPNPTPPALTPDIPVTASKETPTTATAVKPPELSPTDAEFIPLPSYSRWFSWNNVHECEIRFLPEFFDGRSPSKNPRVYKYYRNSIIRRFRDKPTRKISFTEARKTIIGDVGSVRRVFDFLEAWGLINFSGSSSKLQLKWEDKDSKSAAASSQTGDPAGTSADIPPSKKRMCSVCNAVCSIACFACDKYDLTLCARCYVRGHYRREEVNSSDFRRVEISEDIKTDWTDKETLRLLEAVLHYGDNWKKVAEHVGGRSDRECVAQFIKLPVAEQFLSSSDSIEFENNNYETKVQGDSEFRLVGHDASSPSKRMCLSPLADASNPIMAQAAFLSALVGVEVAEAAAGAAVRSLSDVNIKKAQEKSGHIAGGAGQLESDWDDSNENTLKGAHMQLEKEERDLERSIARISEVQMKEIQDKIANFEANELQMERDWHQLQHMTNLLFVDQLTLLFNKTAAPKPGESIDEQ